MALQIPGASTFASMNLQIYILPGHTSASGPGETFGPTAALVVLGAITSNSVCIAISVSFIIKCLTPIYIGLVALERGHQSACSMGQCLQTVAWSVISGCHSVK